jgi:solute carrier family 5 (sodium/glucose cotransporter), member 9
MMSSQGTWWGLMAGLVTGIIRMGVEFAYSIPTCGSGKEDKRPEIITKVHYLIFAIILCSVSFIVMVAVSIMTPPRSKKQVRSRAVQSSVAMLLCTFD